MDDRVHEMSYAEIGSLLQGIRAENRRYKTALGYLWHIIEESNSTDLPVPDSLRQFVLEAHEYYVGIQQNTIDVKESIDFVIDSITKKSITR